MPGYYSDDYDVNEYTLADAKADAAQEAYNKALSPILDEVIQAHLVENYGQDYEENEEHIDVDFDELREELREDSDIIEQAEEILKDQREDSGPCCNDFHCPCGNSNNFRGL